MINFKQTLSDWWKSRQEKNEASKAAKMQQEANKDVNVIEYNGVLYFAYRNIPLIPVSELKTEVTKILPKIRATFITWAKQNNYHAW